MTRRNFFKYSITVLFVTGLVFIGLAAVTKKIKSPANNIQKVNDEKADTTENIGTLTNDDPWKEINNLVNTNADQEGATYSGTIKLIDDNGDDEKILEEYPFEYSQYKGSSYSRLASMEYINKDDLMVVIDNNDKSIAISSRRNSKMKNDVFDIVKFKKIIGERKATLKVTQLGNQKILTVENIQDPGIQGYRVYYTPVTYRISKVLIGMIRLSPLEEEQSPGSSDESPEKQNAATPQNSEEDSVSDDEIEIETYTYYVEVDYASVKKLILKEDDFAPENKFFGYKNGKIELTDAYKGYELLNQKTESSKEDDGE